MSLQEILLVGGDATEPDNLLNGLSAGMADDVVVSCHRVPTLEAAWQRIHTLLPDLMLIAPSLLSAEEQAKVDGFCKRCREEIPPEQRPLIILYTPQASETERITTLVHGADDLLVGDLSQDELRVRVLVHLRRNLDLLSNRTTRLPGLDVTTRFLQRKILNNEPWALLLIDFGHLDPYTEVYGHIPRDQVLRTFASMLTTLVRPPDLAAHPEGNTFAVLTHPDRAEKLAALLCRQFDTAVPNFYAERDRKRGYIVSLLDDRVSRRVGFLTLEIGIVSSANRTFDSYQVAMAAAADMLTMAHLTPGSTYKSAWVSDRLKLSGQTDRDTMPPPKRVLIVESDAALAYLLKTTLEMHHYQGDVVVSTLEAWQVLERESIHLVLMDGVLGGEPLGWDLCRAIKGRFPELPVVFLSSLDAREDALAAGGDLYLPKPFDLMTLFGWVDRLVNESV